MKLCITNLGEIDENALFLLGASTKEGQGKIGFFGSGNKYAIATLLRLGVPFSIYSGMKKIEIWTKGVDFRGEHFDQIVINGSVTSFTTRMGPSWELWFAIREFYCNALDEGGATMDEVEEEAPEAGRTSIYLEETPEVAAFLSDKRRYFISGEEPLWTARTEFGTVRVYDGDDTRRVFRKGICVFEEKRPARFWYDFDGLTINESRVAQYSYEYLQGIAAAIIMAPTERDVLSCIRLLDGESATMEGASLFVYVLGTHLSDAWKSYLAGAEIIRYSWVPHLPPEDVRSGVVLLDAFVDLLQKQAPELHFRDKCNEGFTEVPLTEEQEVVVARVLLGLTETFGYSLSLDSLLFGRFSSDGTMGTYSGQDKKVRISVDYLDDEEELKVTLFEEVVLHKELGYDDGSRRMEQYLMKKYIETAEELKRLKKQSASTVALLADTRKFVDKIPG